MTSIFESPKCLVCEFAFKNNEALDTHMKKTHSESEFEKQNRRVEMTEKALKVFSDRMSGDLKPKQTVGDEKSILKLTADLTDALVNIYIPDDDQEMIKEAEQNSKENLFKFVNTEFKTPSKSAEPSILCLSCQWCSGVFTQSDELVNHFQEQHKIEYNKQKEEGLTVKEPKSTDVSEAENQHPEFERVKYPEKEKDDKFTEDDFQGITLKGNSRKYIQSYNKLKKIMKYQTTFNIKGNILKIVESKPKKPMKVEVLTKENNGKAQIQMYNPGKKRCHNFSDKT